MSILIVASEADASARRVRAALAADGAHVISWDADRFPAGSRISLEREARSATTSFEDGRLEDVTATWIRHVTVGRRLPATLDPAWRRQCVDAAGVVIAAVLRSVPGLRLDPWEATQSAENKPVQLAIARAVGLAIPETLVTSDPGAVRAFVSDHGSAIVKMVSATNFFGADEEGARVFTNRLRKEDLADLDGLSLCPMIFQREIAKAYEVRATIVGDRIFAAAVDSQAAPDAELDWRRRAEDLHGRWRPYALPPEVERRLFDLADELALNYCAIDLMVTPENEHVFLEANAFGAFSFVEQHVGVPIARAVADLLLGRSAPRPTADVDDRRERRTLSSKSVPSPSAGTS